MSDEKFEQSMEELSLKLSEAMEGCLDLGFVLPWYAVMVSTDGGIQAFKITDYDGPGLKVEQIIEHVVNEIVPFPLNVMIVDSKGEAARVLIGPEKTTFQ